MPRLPQVTARPGDVGRAAQPADFGAGVGAATVQLGAEIQDVGQLTGALFTAQQEARVAAASSEAAFEIAQRMQPILQRPDFENDEADFEALSKEVQEKHRGTIASGSFQSAYDARVGDAIQRATLQVQAKSRTKMVNMAEADTDRFLATEADRFGIARTELERFDIRNGMLTYLDSQVAAGLLSPQKRVDLEQGWDKTVLLSDIRESIRNDPLATALELQNPEGRFANLPEAQRQVAMDQSLTAYQQNLRAIETQRARQEKADTKALELQKDVDVREANDFVLALQTAQTPEEAQQAQQGLVELLERTEGTMEPSARNFYRVGLTQGFAVTRSNSDVYLRLEAGIPSGATDRKAINDAWSEDRFLTFTDRQGLLADLDDFRFGEAEDILNETLAVGEAALPNSGKFIAQAAAAEAKQQFKIWKRTHPDATNSDAVAKAQELAADAAFIDLGAQARAGLRPTYRVMLPDGINIDFPATRKATKALRDSGQLSAEDFMEQLRRIKREERAIGLMQQRRASRQPTP